jgi:hypothetical protein
LGRAAPPPPPPARSPEPCGGLFLTPRPPPTAAQRRHGYVVEPRAGMLELLRALMDPSSGMSVTLWSSSPSQVAQELQEKLSVALAGPAAHTNPLGLEHMFVRGKRKEKRLEYFGRSPRSILLIDSNPLSEMLNPDNTVLVKPMEAGGGADATCLALQALVGRVRDEAQNSGAVDVPRALARLRSEAETEGFPTDAMGLHAYLSKRAEEEAAAVAAARSTGLGGLLRSAAAASVLSKAATTAELAVRRPYRDPAVELGEDSLLTRRVRETSARVFGPQR